MAETILRTGAGGHDFSIENIASFIATNVKTAATEADGAANKDGMTSVPEVEAYVRELDANAAVTTGSIREELLARAARAREALETLRKVQFEPANQPVEVQQRLVSVAREVIADSMAAGATAEGQRLTFEERIHVALAQRGLSSTDRYTVWRVAMEMARRPDPDDGYSRYRPSSTPTEEDRLLKQPTIAAAITQARESTDTNFRNRAMRARTAFGIQARGGQDINDIYRARTDAARALTAAQRGSEAYGRVNAQIVPLLTSSDDTQRARGNQLVQSMVEPNHHYRTCVVDDPWSGWNSLLESLVWHQSSRQSRCLWSREKVEELGGYAEQRDKQAYAIDLVGRLTPEQLRQLEPGTVRAVVDAIVGMRGDGTWVLWPTQETANITDGWSVNIPRSAASPAGQAALDRLFGALPPGMFQRTHGASEGTIILGFNPLPRTP